MEHILVNLAQFKDALRKQHVNLWNFWEANMPHKDSKNALYADNAPNKWIKWASNKVREYGEFTKSFKISHFKNCWSLELGCLLCTLHLNMVCFKYIYFGYFKKTVKKLIYFYSQFLNISQFTLAASSWTSVSMS